MDPFAGSCVTGEVAERLRRKWICCDTVEEYLKGALGRFEENREVKMESVEVAYSVFRPGYLWDSMPDKALDANGGKNVKARKPKF